MALEGPVARGGADREYLRFGKISKRAMKYFLFVNHNKSVSLRISAIS